MTIRPLRPRPAGRPAFSGRACLIGPGDHEAFKRLGAARPRISDPPRGKFNQFGLDHPATMPAPAGRQAEIRVKAEPRS
jgi:hypothetical protein